MMVDNRSLSHPFRACKPSDLLRTQARAVEMILKRFAAIAKDALHTQPAPPTEFRAGWDVNRKPDPEAGFRTRRDVNRPHNVCTIDGARGSGKTYTLLSLEDALQGLSDFWRYEGKAESNEARRWEDFLHSRIGQDTLNALVNVRRTSSYTDLLQILNIIFPGDMEGRESLMEAIFAGMMKQLEGTIRDHRNSTSDQDKNLTKRATDLCNILRTQVAQGWYFSKNFGHDSIVRDSIDYTDYIQKLETETRKAAQRIDAWRRFIIDYLEFYKVATLIILVDDSDVKPELTSDILHSIRMFLNHPRLLTVLASNVRTMRNTLVHQAMRLLGQSMHALSNNAGQTANDWRRTERKAVEDYLDKILPLASRFFVSQPSLYEESTADSSIAINPSDFQKITKTTFSKVCTEMLHREREMFLKEKFHLAIEHAMGNSDVPGAIPRRHLEAYLAWWIFFNRYASSLAPKSARQIVTFRDYYIHFVLNGDKASSHLASPNLNGDKASSRPVSPKRLIIALFENPANYALIQQFGDEDANVVTWLQHQSLQSIWVGERQFEVNSRIINRGQYSYDYIRFRLDVALAMPVRDNAEEVLPRELLPMPKGRRYIRRFFQPQYISRRQRRLGVARWIDHAVIPGNCLYFYDLESLPDCSLIPTKTMKAASVKALQSGAWEAELADNWIEAIEDGQDEFTYRYFTEVVCASQRETAKRPSTELIALLDPQSITRQQNEAAYEVFWRDEFKSFAIEGDPAPRWQESNPNNNGNAQGIRRNNRRVAMYAALITDIRRAWHAIRIYEHSPLKTDTLIPGLPGNPPASFVNSEDERASFTVIATQDRLRLYTRKQIAELFEKTSWIQQLLDVFSCENVTAAINSFTENINGLELGPYPADWKSVLRLEKDSIKALYSAESPDAEGEKVPQPTLGENRDFADWTRRLRILGRITCEGWPDFGDARTEDDKRHTPWLTDQKLEERLRAFEEQLFKRVKGNALSEAPEICRLSAFDDEKLSDENRQTRRDCARAARNFVWLLYGLAPSLPAVIHTHIMGIVYQAELIFYGSSVGSGGDQELEKEALDDVMKLHADSLQEIDAWAELVGRLSAILRYIRVKYLHLHIGLALESILNERKSYDSVEVRAATFLRHCGYKIEEQNVLSVFQRMEQLFVGNKRGELATDLAIMPDVASSTLFGEHWLSDTLKSLVNLGKIQLDSGPASHTARVDSQTHPLFQVNGVFAETEQWLWATNRFLRKLRGEIVGAPQQRN